MQNFARSGKRSPHSTGQEKDKWKGDDDAAWSHPNPTPARPQPDPDTLPFRMACLAHRLSQPFAPFLWNHSAGKRGSGVLTAKHGCGAGQVDAAAAAVFWNGRAQPEAGGGTHTGVGLRRRRCSRASRASLCIVYARHLLTTRASPPSSLPVNAVRVQHTRRSPHHPTRRSSSPALFMHTTSP